jgi:hypothetical protein
MISYGLSFVLAIRVMSERNYSPRSMLGVCWGAAVGPWSARPEAVQKRLVRTFFGEPNGRCGGHIRTLVGTTGVTDTSRISLSSLSIRKSVPCSAAA